MLGEQGNDHTEIFQALGFVHRNGICQDEFVQVRISLHHGSAVKDDLDLLVFCVYPEYPLDVPIVDLLVTVVPDLHHLIAYSKISPVAGYAVLSRVEYFLELDVQVAGSNEYFIGFRTWTSSTGSKPKAL